jgi:hypothetical protein
VEDPQYIIWDDLDKIDGGLHEREKYQLKAATELVIESNQYKKIGEEEKACIKRILPLLCDLDVRIHVDDEKTLRKLIEE